MTKRIKILFTIPNFNTAGSQYVVKTLVSRMDTLLFEPYVGVESAADLIPNIVPPDYKLLLPTKEKGLKAVLKFRQLLKKHHIDIVHSWDYKSHATEVLASRLAGVAYVFTKKNNSWSKAWIFKSLLANHIAYDNPLMQKRFFDALYVRNKVTFIPHGVDVDLFQAAPTHDKTNFSLCSIGEINSNKNQLFILKALLDLPHEVQVCFYGREEFAYKAQLMTFINAHNLIERVHFKGYIANESIPVVLNQHDVFVLASKHEGMPVSILEALACGLPVLSSDSGGGSRYIIDTTKGGFLFSLETTDELVKQVMDLKQNPELYREVSEAATRNTRKRFNIQKEVDAYKSLYLKCVHAEV